MISLSSLSGAATLDRNWNCKYTRSKQSIFCVIICGYWMYAKYAIAYILLGLSVCLSIYSSVCISSGSPYSCYCFMIMVMCGWGMGAGLNWYNANWVLFWIYFVFTFRTLGHFISFILFVSNFEHFIFDFYVFITFGLLLSKFISKCNWLFCYIFFHPNFQSLCDSPSADVSTCTQRNGIKTFLFEISK